MLIWILKHDLFNYLCTEIANIYFFFVATKDKFEVPHLPDLINDVPVSFSVFDYLFNWNQRNILTCSIVIIATPSGGLIKS